ncbi:MAG TPA: hypothetical protein ENN33_12050 [Ignavibacteria bacterium]|nr:hypothetical protein [Ignavibacteria bacterium]
MMKILSKYAIFAFLLLSGYSVTSRTQSDSVKHNNFSTGGYGHIGFNKPFVAEQNSNSKIDVHRVVLLFRVAV